MPETEFFYKYKEAYEAKQRTETLNVIQFEAFNDIITTIDNKYILT